MLFHVPFGLLRAAVRTATRFGLVLTVLAMLALNVATLTFAGLNALISGTIATVSGIQTVAQRQKARAATLGADLATARQTAAQQAEELTAARRTAAQKANELKAARRTVARQTGDLARARVVSYRGETMPVARAVSDTAGRISARTATATARNLAATGAEAIPVWGVGVIAAATAYELKVACDTLRDLHELDLAFNPDAALDPDRAQACGTEVPTAGELWATVSASPAAAAEAAHSAHDGLPAFDPSDWWSLTLSRATDFIAR